MKKILLLSLLLLATWSCKKESYNDNLYKFREYMYYTTSGRVSVASPIQIVFSKDVTDQNFNAELKKGIVEISPSIKAQFILKDNRTIEIYPEKNLKPNTEYTVKVHLNKLFKNVPSKFKKFQFQFKTIEPNFVINTGNLQSYSKEWQYLEGNLKSADIMSIDALGNVLIATQNGKKLNVKWQENANTDFSFIIDSIARPMEDSEIEVSWNGKKLNINNEGSQKVKIPGRNHFVVLGVNAIQEPDQYLEINFSDPLKKDQIFDGLVTIEGSGPLNFAADGNVLKVYFDNVIEGSAKVEIFQGIESEDGIKLKENFSEMVEFAQLKPELRVINKGVILPDSKNLTYNFEAVNLKSVTVRVVKIYENNILQFLQENEISDNDAYNIRKVGRRVAKKKITLIQDEKLNTGKWTAYAIDLADLIKADPGSIYRVELSFDQSDVIYKCETSVQTSTDEEDAEDEYYEDEYYYDESANYSAEETEDLEEREEQYWDNLIYSYKRYNYNWEQRENPCHAAYYNEERVITSNVLASNIGFIVKKGQNQNYFFTVTNILTTEPITGAKVTLYNYQQQELGSTKTNDDGLASLKIDKNAYFAIATFNEQKTYLKISEGNSLSLSKFDVAGKEMKKGLQGYLFGERGVWRPGDTLHLTFVLNDKANPIPNGHPINFELRDARGQLVYKQISNHEPNKFHKFTVPTNDSDPTGNWNATVKVGGATFNQSLKIATIKPNRLRLNLDFGSSEVIKAKEGIRGKLTVNWLHGAIAKNLKADIKMKLTSTNEGFKGYPNYIFQDPSREFQSEEITVFEGNVNNDGIANINKAFTGTQSAPGMLKATFMARAFEPGGDFSMDVFSKNVAPYSSFVGILPPKPDNYGSYTTDKNTSFSIVTVDENGKPINKSGLEVKVYKIDWRWWWSSSYDNVASYISSQYHEQVYDKTIATSNGKSTFSINIPNEKGGRYLIRVLDPTSGHATGFITYFYRDWWRSPSGTDDQSANMLVFATDKTNYNVGETAHLTFPSGSEGRALISIENGSGVVKQNWIKTKKGETKVELPITADMTPNVFINISLLQPHAGTANDLPLRLFGVIPIMVEDPKTRLNPQITMPEVLKPETDFTVKVSEKSGKAMTYTLAVVDEGLLDITRFKTPNIWNEFYQKQALGVTTWDIFDEVIGAYGGTIDQVFSIGGDEGGISKKGKKANRFKPVVMYLGPFRLEKGQTSTHNIHMPNYVGSVRTMLIAGDNSTSAYGSVEKSTPVRKPLMLLASLPRKLSPGEKVTLPVTVFAMENKVKNVNVQIKPENGIQIIGNTNQSISFDKPDEKVLYFDLDVSQVNGIGKIKVNASGNGETASYEVEIDVENANPISNKFIDVELQPNASQEITFNTFGEIGTNNLQLEFSTLPPMDFNRRLQYLIGYPHGCIEQTTSGVFPQLYLKDLFDLTAQQKQKIDYHIKEGIKAIGLFQNPDGGLGYWRGEKTADDWGSSYAGHFMIEAEKKGYVLPLTFKTNWLKYQKQAAKIWRPTYRSYNTDLAQAYRLYTLALAGEPDLAAMNRLREFKEISNEGRWRLAAAYALAGQKEVAKKLANQSNINFSPYSYDYYTYGSPDRNRAMALETMLLTGQTGSLELAKQIAKDLSSDYWMSTQSTAYSLLALSKMLQKNGGKSMDLTYQISNKSDQVKTEKAIAIRDIKLKEGKYVVTFRNSGSNIIYVRALYSGKLPVGQEVSSNRNLTVNITYETPEGKTLDSNKLMQGTDFKAKITVTNTSQNYVRNLALTQIFPSGWEIINTDFAGYGTATAQANFVDMRDDRVNFYFDLAGNKSKTFIIDLNASYLGRYYKFGSQVEAMYDNEYFARNKGNWVEVVK